MSLEFEQVVFCITLQEQLPNIFRQNEMRRRCDQRDLRMRIAGGKMGTFAEEDESGAGGKRCVGAKFSGMNGQDSAFRQKGGTFAQRESVVVKSQ